jgi:hypothetical protein
MRTLKKEACTYCSKNINIGQAVVECKLCNIPIHARCHKKAGFVLINNKFYCQNCSLDVEPIYNPFEDIASISESNSDHDKHYENDITDVFDELETMRNLLNSCKSLGSASDLNRQLQLLDINDCNFSTMFKNIDGNKSNFDSFAVDMQQVEHSFSVIGLAETNLDPSIGELYPLENYKSIYQDINPSKFKGTGVALYIHESLNYTKVDKLSQCSENFESLFIQTQVGNTPYTVGVIYNPPSGEDSKFIVEFKNLLQKCPTKNLKIMGDFNFDLLKLQGENCKAFEELILEHGIYPLISVYTHAKPNCRKSCIDNILSNNPSSVLISGTVDLDSSHHRAVFQISNINHGHIEKEAETQYYDFCKSNLEAFLSDLQKCKCSLDGSKTFEGFLDIYNQKIDQFFKLVSPILSKRNRKVNPWITDGLIISVLKKESLYDEWKESTSKDNPEGNPFLKLKYKDYRRALKHTINAAKLKYYGIKLGQNTGNLKKTWALLNELRGKRKPGMKAHFMIDNQRIINRRVIANEFNKYFVSLAANMNESAYGDPSNTGALPVDAVDSFAKYMSSSHPSTIYMYDSTPEEILEIINGLDNNKSSDIPIKVIKSSGPIICHTVSRCINECMSSRNFP